MEGGVSPASFKIMLEEPEAPPTPGKPVDPAALTREERSNMGWHVRFIAWVLGLPSILSIGFVCCVGLYYANAGTGDALTRLALSVGILVITLFTAGLPIGAAGLSRKQIMTRAKCTNYGVTWDF